MDMQIAEYEIIDLGVDHPEYFPGYSLSPESDFDELYIGVGDSAYEAVGDALDQIALDGYDVLPIEDESLTDFADMREPDVEGEEVHYVAFKIRKSSGEAQAEGFDETANVPTGDPEEFDYESWVHGEGECAQCGAPVEKGQVLCDKCEQQVEKNRRFMGSAGSELQRDLQEAFYSAVSLSENLEGEAKEGALALAAQFKRDGQELERYLETGEVPESVSSKLEKRKNHFLDQLMDLPDAEKLSSHPVDDNNQLLTRDLTADSDGYDGYYDTYDVVQCDRCGEEADESFCDGCMEALDALYAGEGDEEEDEEEGLSVEVEVEIEGGYEEGIDRENPLKHEEYDREYDLEPYIPEEDYLDMEMNAGSEVTGAPAIESIFTTQVLDELGLVSEDELDQEEATTIYDIGEAVAEELAEAYGVEEVQRALKKLLNKDSDISIAADAGLSWMEMMGTMLGDRRAK